MNRRNFIKAIGIGGLIPFVKTEAAPPAPSPQPQPQNAVPLPRYASGTASFFPISGSVSFSVDGVNWQELGKITGYSFGGEE